MGFAVDIPVPIAKNKEVMDAIERAILELDKRKLKMEERSPGKHEDLSQKKWASNDSAFWRGTKTFERIPPGLYKMAVASSVGPMLTSQNIVTDNLLVLPDRVNQSILDEFESFWKKKESFREHGFTHKRGMLLYGPPGSGKTSAIQLLIQDLVNKKEGIVLFADEPQVAGHCLQMVRDIEPERPMIVIFEDIDALVYKHGENEYLALLDGEAQVDNVVFLATTNYPERLDKRFVDRPSRFDILFEVDMPTAASRDMYLREKEPQLSDEERTLWVKRTEGFSIAHLKEVIVSVKCLGRDLEHTLARLQRMIDEIPKSDKFKESTVGFAPRKKESGESSYNPVEDPDPYAGNKVAASK